MPRLARLRGGRRGVRRLPRRLDEILRWMSNLCVRRPASCSNSPGWASSAVPPEWSLRLPTAAITQEEPIPAVKARARFEIAWRRLLDGPCWDGTNFRGGAEGAIIGSPPCAGEYPPRRTWSSRMPASDPRRRPACPCRTCALTGFGPGMGGKSHLVSRSLASESYPGIRLVAIREIVMDADDKRQRQVCSEFEVTGAKPNSAHERAGPRLTPSVGTCHRGTNAVLSARLSP